MLERLEVSGFFWRCSVKMFLCRSSLVELAYVCQSIFVCFVNECEMKNNKRVNC